MLDLLIVIPNPAEIHRPTMPGTVNDKKKSKNQWRREQAKLKKEKASGRCLLHTGESLPDANKSQGIAGSEAESVTIAASTRETTLEPEAKPINGTGEDDEPIVAEPATSFAGISEDDPLYESYRHILTKFSAPVEEEQASRNQIEVFRDDDDDIPDEENEARKAGLEAEEADENRKSKKQLKRENKLSVAELKAYVRRPELVDWTDTSSREPTLLVALKGTRNIVPVPAHWNMKREYLSSKRGIEKPQWEPPQYIKDTGVPGQRDEALKKTEESTLKSKQREKVQPKMGKAEVDYSKLYDAFFRYQTKPPMSRFGEIYYEGKEYETNLRHLQPGLLSDELREALNMPPNAPPPWLINQQRFGPPPSYPALKIPGLNAPPPEGGSWGFNPGGYGRPPVDEANRPLYGGDIFGVPQNKQEQRHEQIERKLWGELVAPDSEDEDEEESEEDGDGEMGEGEMASGMATQTDGLQSMSGISSVTPSDIGGTETSQEFAIRKDRRGTETEQSSHPRSAGQVIPEQQASTAGFFGSDRRYDLSGSNQERGTKRKAGDVEVSVDVDTLMAQGKMSKEDLQKQYDAGRKAEAAGQWAQLNDEDFTSFIAEQSSKRLKKDQERKGRK